MECQDLHTLNPKITEEVAVGQTIAETFAANGANKVYVVGRRKASLDRVAEKWNGTIIPLQGDVSNKKTITKIVDDWRAMGETKLDILVNSAGKGLNPPYTERLLI